MSIALNARIKDMERRLKELESAVDVLRAYRVKMDALPVLMAADNGHPPVPAFETVAAVVSASESWDEDMPSADDVIPAPVKRKPGRPRKESNGS